jgi:DNA-binding LytR/AlgR family response regulator
MEYKVAILEDDPYQLKDLKETLTGIPKLKVTCWATGSIDFIKCVEADLPDFIIVDINLNGDPSSGILVANRLKLPVIFASGNNAAYLKDIETLKRDHDLLVEHITKPIREYDLMKTVSQFMRDLELRRSKAHIWLKLGDMREKIDQTDIIYIGTDKSLGSESNNKVIYFKNRKPGVLIDFSFVKMAQTGFDISLFKQIHKSFIVNKEEIVSFDSHSKTVHLKIQNESGLITEISLPVSDNYKQHLRG